MGHINFYNLINIRKGKAVRDIPKITNPSNFICKHGLHGKQTRISFKTKEYSTTKPLELVHISLCGTMRTKGLYGDSYFILFIDYYTIITWVCFLKRKSESFETFKVFKKVVENETDLKINCLKSDNGGEFTSNEFENFYEKHGIRINL